MNESFPSQPNKFVESESGLLLPATTVDAPAYTTRNGYQEMQGQNEIFGTEGHGSIRAESVEDRTVDQNAENLEKSIDDMLDPQNVIDLKGQLESKTTKQLEEKQLFVSKRLDKDSTKQAEKTRARQVLKEQLIDEYTQIGADPENPREIPEIVRNDISRMLDMSFDELEAAINLKNSTKKTAEKESIGKSAVTIEPLVPADVELAKDDIESGKTVFDEDDLGPVHGPEQPLTPSTELAIIETPEAESAEAIVNAPDERSRFARIRDRVSGAFSRAKGRVAGAYTTVNVGSAPEAENSAETRKDSKILRNAAIGSLAVAAGVGAFFAYKAGLHEKAADAIGNIFDGDNKNVKKLNGSAGNTGLDEHISKITPEAVPEAEILPTEIPTFDVPKGGSITGTMMDNFGLDVNQAKYVYDHIPAEEWLKLPNTYDMHQNGWVGISNSGEGAFSFGELTGRVLELAEEAKKK